MAATTTTAFAGRTMFGRLTSIPLRYPMAFGAGLSCVKTSGSDLLVQKVVEQRDKIDWKRNIAFGTFGLCYLGIVQYSIYVSLFGRMFPNAASFAAKSVKDKLKDVRGMAALGAQVFLDQCVHHPLLYFPVFYATKELVVNSDKPDLGRCLTDYWNNMSEDLAALWKIWVPCTIVNFAFMPMHLRIPFTAGVSMVWSCVLSAMRGGDVAHGDDMIIGGAITGATLKIFEEGFSEYFTCPVELDRDMAHVVVSASGADKTGWVALLTRAVADQGGNVTYSRMVRLGSDFIILMHVAVPPEQQRTLVRALKNNKELKALNLRTSSVTRRMTGKYDKPALGLTLHCVGEDGRGMLALISEQIAGKGLSIETIDTELRMGKNGRRDFVVNADLTSPVALDQDELKSLVDDMSTLKNSLGLDVVDVRVHRAKPTIQ